MDQRYNLALLDDEKKRFSLISTFGIPVSELKDFLSKSSLERKEFIQQGIPIDSTSNELAEWIVYARMINPNLRVAINGDTQTKYPTIKKVINTLVNNKVIRLNLITDQKKALADG